MPKLNVNIDHVATVRQARGGAEPDPVLAAYLAELAGADGIVAHLREDRRHIQDRDLQILRRTVKTKLNLEMAATDAMIQIAREIKPQMATLVPEKRQELTTEGGLNVAGFSREIADAVRELKSGGIFVSLFIDPDREQIEACADAGANMVEIHTGLYADAKTESEMYRELIKIEDAIAAAVSLNLRAAAGHGLNYTNTRDVASIKGVEELNIGHSIVSRAVIVGMERAVREMILCCAGSSNT
ncbi:MAG: pyridoxine 5'-phosphate synthase [Deltaproteobacteria bacterium]